MAKQTKAAVETAQEEVQESAYTAETTVKVTTVKEITETKEPVWEIKDRTYYLMTAHSPLTFKLNSRHTSRYPLLWFDEKAKEQFELRYATNQNSPLVKNQKGESTLGHIVFNNGTLTVSKEKQNLQKLLSLYHPALNRKYREFNPVATAQYDLEDIETEIEALNAAMAMDIDHAESIMRVELGSRVTKMSSKELKRDLLLFARRNPDLFLELANDENVQLRNVAIRAAEENIVTLSQDQRTFTWASTGRKLMTVPFDENPYSAMAAYFKTDEGVEVFRSIEKKLK